VIALKRPTKETEVPSVERMLTRRRSGDDVVRGLGDDDDDVDDDSDGAQATSIVRNCRLRGPQLR